MKSPKNLAIILFACTTFFGCVEDFSDDINELNLAIELLNGQLSDMSNLAEQQRQDIEDYRSQVDQLNIDLEKAKTDAKDAKSNAEKSKDEATQAKSEAEQAKTEAEQAKFDAEQAKKALENKETSESGNRIIYPKIEYSDGSKYVSPYPYDIITESYCNFFDLKDSTCNPSAECDKIKKCCLSEYYINNVRVLYSEKTEINNSNREILGYFTNESLLYKFSLITDNEFVKQKESFFLGTSKEFCTMENNEDRTKCENFFKKIENSKDLYFYIKTVEDHMVLSKPTNIKVGDIIRGEFLTYKVIEETEITRNYYIDINGEIQKDALNFVKVDIIPNEELYEMFVCQF